MFIVMFVVLPVSFAAPRVIISPQQPIGELVQSLSNRRKTWIGQGLRQVRIFDAKREFDAHPELLSEASSIRRDLREIALKCFLETRDIDRARNLVETMVADDGETPNILLKRASIFGLQAQYHEASEILLRLNRDFPGRPAILRRLVVVFEQLRDIGKASAFLKAYGRDNPNDTWVSEKRERFAALGFR